MRYTRGMSAVPALLDQEPNDLLWRTILAADEIGIRLEVVDGQSIWEFFPGPRHQKESFRIQASVRRVEGHAGDCACFHMADVYIQFADGSVKRPDLSIFCKEPPEDEGFIRQVPTAVVEILSPGSGHKDLVQGPPFYLEQGVKDVIVFDPRSGEIRWFSQKGEQKLRTPAQITTSSGCEMRV